MEKYKKLLENSKQVSSALLELFDSAEQTPQIITAKALLVNQQRFIEDLEEHIESPCIKKCVTKDGVCTGCYRSIDEISKWIFMNNKEKQQVIKNCELRKLH